MKNINKKLKALYFVMLSIFVNADIILADDLINNPITNGIKNMLNDGLKALMLISTIATPALIAWFQLRKKFCEDEMEAKQYDKKTKATIFCYVIIMGASSILAIVSNYFNF